MNWEDILLAVERPSRYTGGEVNAVKKDRRAWILLKSPPIPGGVL